MEPKLSQELVFLLPQVKATGARVPEVWYSSPYCPPEAEIAQGNEDSWSSISDDGVKEDKGEEAEEEEKKNKKPRVWVSVEPSTDSWALGILSYAMLTGSHPWAETTSGCRSYLRYREWFDSGAEAHEDKLGTWAELQTTNAQDTVDLAGTNIAPQFACFTPLARSFFRSLLDPRPSVRGQPEEALSFLRGDWMMEKERVRLEEERKKRREKGKNRHMKEKEGRRAR